MMKKPYAAGKVARETRDRWHAVVVVVFLQERGTTGAHDFSENIGNVTNNNGENRGRVLLDSHNFFRQPSCECVTRSTWSAQNYDTTQLVRIPCGTCVTIDVFTGILTLQRGMDVQGRLDFPNSIQNLEIRTPFLRVQGTLVMKSTRIVGGNAQIKLVLTEDPKVSTSFVPVEPNKYACSSIPQGVPTACTVGQKAVAVAGGQVNIQGLPTGCKTWVKLQDVVKAYSLPNPTRFSKLPDPDLYCHRHTYEETFDSGNVSTLEWSAWDATWEISRRNSLYVSKRQSAGRSGPAVNLMGIRDCFLVGQTYLFSARVRIRSNDPQKKGLPTTCATSSRDRCLRLNSFSRFASGALYRTKGTEKQAQYSQYDRWFNFNVEFIFEAADVAPNALYHSLVVTGPEANYDIEIDDVSFGLPPESTVPDPDSVCAGNLIMGNANAINSYPHYMIGSGRLDVFKDSFRVDRRQEPNDSVAHSLNAPGCIVPGGEYMASARIRVLSATPVKPIMVMRIFYTRSGNRSPFRRVVAECRPSRRKFVLCKSNFLMEEQFDESDIEEVRFSFETENSKATFDVKKWSVELVEVSTSSIVVQEEGVKDCWGSGADLLITSHTTDFEHSQRRRLVDAPKPHSNDYVRLELDHWVIPPVTVADGDGFAVEVALLSRNVVFQGENDESDPLLGGHMIVMNTPNVQQRIEGLELENFGRQGELGRYPIHFHLCANVHGSVVAKNSIRNSNQRCIVVHGSHNLTVSDNVSYENKGHCYILEDGGELDNSFVRNLGSNTRAARRLVRPFETDREMPSTFWCSNPMNSWIDNVAAGGVSTGFWFELQREVRSPTAALPTSMGMSPRYLPLKLFRGNVAHSYGDHGLRTYPPVFHHLYSYKNQNAGVFFHNSQDLHIVGGILADNEIQCDFDRMDNAVIRGTRVIGTTNRYKEIVSLQTGRIAHTDRIVGIQLHGHVLDVEREGAAIRNVLFSGFSDKATTAYTALIDVDNKKSTGHFDYWTTMKGLKVSGGVKDYAFDFSRAAAIGVVDILLTDTDSSMRPIGSTASGVSSVMSNSMQMKSFINTTDCHEFSTRGYLYCENTCLYTFTFAVDPSGTDRYVLFIRDKKDASKTKSFQFPGKYDYETIAPDSYTLDKVRNTWIQKPRYFAAALPLGSYYGDFRDKETNEIVWPSFVEATLEPNACKMSMPLNAVELATPAVHETHCRNLIRNGNMETSSPSYWLHHNAGVEFVNGGIGGSSAIASTLYGSEPNVFIGQFLDSRCIEAGQQYSVRASIKLIDPRDDAIVSCTNGKDGGCPFLQLRVRTPVDSNGSRFVEEGVPVGDSVIRPLLANGWMQIQGIVTLGQVTAGASSVALGIYRGPRRVKMLIDEVAMEHISAQCNNDLVFNGSFDSKTSASWGTDTRSIWPYLQIDSFSGNPALRLVSRTSSLDSVAQNIRTGCLKRDERYIVTANIRLVERNSKQARTCDRHVRTGNRACPRARIKSFINVEQPNERAISVGGGPVADADHGLTSSGWMTLTGSFLASIEDEEAGRITLLIGENAVSGIDIAVDDVAVQHVKMDCSELFLNGDGTYDTARFWRPALGANQAKIDVQSEGNNRFLKLSNRSASGDGIHQKVDTRCLAANSSWILAARMKLLHRSDGQGVVCDPSDFRLSVSCPSVRLVGYDTSSNKIVDDTFNVSSKASWSSLDWNNYRAEFTISDDLASANEVWIGIRSFNTDWDLVVDDLSVSPM